MLQNKQNILLLDSEKFNTILGYFRVACMKNNIKKPAIVCFVDFLQQKKDQICEATFKKPKNSPQYLENSTKFEAFIVKFFEGIKENPKL